jgi:hypothetical protein
VTDIEVPDEPPEETEVFEQYDEESDAAIDDDGHVSDPAATGISGSERDLTRFTEMPVDTLENEEIGLGFDDPQRMAVLDGGMDDPDGIDPSLLDPADDEPARVRSDLEPGPESAGWDLDAGERP